MSIAAQIEVWFYSRAKDECTLDANVMHNHTAEVAADHHQTECERITCVH